MFTLREMTPDDSAAVSELARNSPDTGRVQIHVEYEIPAYDANKALKPNFIGVVAEHPDHTGIVGAGLVSFKDYVINGNVRRGALLSSLMVHPVARQQGLAGKLASWRINKARELYGDDVMIFAGIQDGNIGSIKNAEKWANQWLREGFTVAPTRVNQKPPQHDARWTVRNAKPNEYALIAERINAQYGERNFHVPTSAEKIAKLVNHQPTGEPFWHYLVVENGAGELVSGITIMDSFRVRIPQVDHAPMMIRALNVFLKLLPSDGILRGADASEFWYLSGYEDAASYLWQTVLYQWHDNVGSVRIDYDARSGIEPLLKASRMQIRARGMLAVYCPEQIDLSRLNVPALN